MASQTKVEPSDSSTPPAPASGVGASTGLGDPEQPLGYGAAEPDSHVEAMTAGDDGQPGDDEDVSLDELMMSGEEDEPDEATDVQGHIVRPPPPSETSAASDSTFFAGPGQDDETPPGPDAAFGVASLEDDEAAALASAAAAQEAAAQAAEAEARHAAEAEARHAAEAEARHAAEAEARHAAELAERAREVVAEAPGAELAGDSDDRAADVVPPHDAASLSADMAEAPLAAAGAAAADDPDDEPPMSVDFEAPATEEAAAPGDAPLPSFDIPEPEARTSEPPSRHTPRPMAVLPQLSEVAEDDDDDAVTHIGLPVVPEAPADYALGATAFSVAEPGVGALGELDVDLTDARRATTRVVPRIDPGELARRRLASDPVASSRAGRRAPLGTWLSGVFQRYRPEPPRASGSDRAPRRAGWLLDTVLPPLSLVLFGSGIGAGIMLLQPDRGARAAQQVQTVQALREAQKKPATLAEKAEAGDGDALFKITNMAPDQRSSALTLALERGYQTQRQNEFKDFARTLEQPSGLSQPNLTTHFLSYATSPETMLAAFSHLLSWPGSTGPDVLYNVWEKAPGGSRAASLAQQLLHAEDQRAKATPALITALDLRTATSCEDYLRVMPAVQKNGDQRCSATLRALKHKDGCGDDGKQDCFACLREGTLLDDALAAIEARPAPQL